MPLPYLPQRGEILICDFDDFAIGAEMIKRRPVVVVSHKETHRRKLCAVVPFSTTAPSPVEPWHHPLPHVSITGWVPSAPMWAKADMIATVSLDRLNKPYRKTRHGRNFIAHFLSDADLEAVMSGLKSFLRL